MRRAAPTAGLSPQLIKHFAIVTVSITALLALFASGEDWGAQAQLEAVEAKNQLAAAEAEKLGAKKVLAKLKVRTRISGAIGGDGGSDSPTGGGGSLYPEPVQQNRDDIVLPEAARGGPRGPMPARLLPGQSTSDRAEATPGQPKRKLTEAELEAMLESSRQRSGSSSSDN